MRNLADECRVIAGPERAVEKFKPYTIGVMGRAIIDLTNKSPSNATLLKVIGNTFVFNLVEAIAQGHTMAEKTGLGVDNLHKFIELMFPGPYTAYSNRMRDGDYFKREEVRLTLRQASFLTSPLAALCCRSSTQGCIARHGSC
jgi:3-hydroxyisobutyrate dehydrogenase-like beta-hydroxyacid dehydrogenase